VANAMAAAPTTAMDAAMMFNKQPTAATTPAGLQAK